jgi:hypothetical protein
MLDRLVGHRRLEVPAGIIEEGIDSGGVAEQIWLPLARFTSYETVEVVKAHSIRPLIEWSGLARLVEGCVVVFAEPCGRISVRFQNGTDRALLDRND